MTGIPAPALPPDLTVPTKTAAVDVVIPVYSEERALRGCVDVLKSSLDEQFPFEWTLTIVDNASTDATLAIAGEPAEATDRVRVLYLDE
ncbi:MAG TPA: glycosyltransferase [Streptomyces sp.]|nr:glycosyltransferase [Streptomyces sp.]